MKKLYSKAATVPYEEAKRRALTVLTSEPRPAATIADVIWPDNKMKAQGAGGAASRILRRMQDEGLAKWTSTDRRWGWVCVRNDISRSHQEKP